LTSSVPGIDVLKSWQKYTGLGVKVGIIDDGFDYIHSDLKPHYLFNLDYDSTTGGSDALDSQPTAMAQQCLAVLGGARWLEHRRGRL
jgi:hypothetical protein